MPSGISSLLIDNLLVCSEKDKASLLNSYFSRIYTNENMNNHPDVYEAAARSNGSSLSDVVITPKAVEEKPRMLNYNRPLGPDGIPARVLKELAPPLSILFSKSIVSGVLPLQWKTVFLKGTHSSPDNY